MSAGLTMPFDVVVMLTLSDWRTEMRSNRYHYATRFARHLPVIFVQPDLAEPRFEYEESEVNGVVLLHVYSIYGWKQCALLNRALSHKGVRKPLLWVYNPRFLVFIAMRHAPCTVYHATEDYFSPDFRLLDSSDLRALRAVLKLSDLLVAVSEGVKHSYQERGDYGGEAIVIENGCDFKFWAPRSDDEIHRPSHTNDKWIAFYQGGINRKIDFTLMHEVVRRMPDWEFWFCGGACPEGDDWNSLIRQVNVKYWGKLRPDEVRNLTYQSTVGLIPFLQNDWIIERSFPLKALEYLACGLPVVSVPIKALRPFSEVMYFAETPDQFIDAMRRNAPARHQAEGIAQRVRHAREHDYDLKFKTVLSSIAFVTASQASQRTTYHVLYVRNKIIVLEGFRKEISRLKRAFAMAVIHYCARAIAMMVKKDPEQLEEDLLRLSRKMRGIPVPRLDHSR